MGKVNASGDKRADWWCWGQNATRPLKARPESALHAKSHVDKTIKHANVDFVQINEGMLTMVQVRGEWRVVHAQTNQGSQ